MKKTAIHILCVSLMGLVQIAVADGNYQFPPAQAQAYSVPVAPALNQGYAVAQPQLYYYPQYMAAYPVTSYAAVPNAYGYPASYGYNPYQAGLYPQQAQVQQAQAPARQFQYTSPYNPNMPATPGPKPTPPPQPKKEVKPWGDTRYIWPDFYTDFTGDFWDKMINAPHDLGYMPGGWRFPSFSSPDPVTVGDAVANQVPPIMEEVPNFIDFTN